MLRSIVAAAIGLTSLNSLAAFEPLTDAGTPVLRQCTGIPDPITGIAPTPTQCEVATTPIPDTTLNGSANGSAFPGQAGNWALVAAQTGISIIANGTTVGTLEDRVWKQVGGTGHILGLKVVLTPGVTWTEPAVNNMGIADVPVDADGCNSQAGQSFEINDMFRAGLTGKTGLTVAFRESSISPAEEGMFLSGRTQQGRAFVAPGGVATRDNEWVNFRTDVNPADPDPTTRGNSKWMYLKTTSTKTVWSTTASTIRLEQGGEEGQCKYRITLSGFRP
jgi:hypothetical protein